VGRETENLENDRLRKTGLGIVDVRSDEVLEMAR
jgi:hypothetical protein